MRSTLVINYVRIIVLKRARRRANILSRRENGGFPNNGKMLLDADTYASVMRHTKKQHVLCLSTTGRLKLITTLKSSNSPMIKKGQH